ncbi:MAG: GGDEF domain-containing protein [Treponema sp.]|jgi:diguanylate cyclase (GGDEF)-like protein|nr:GGDEF domain-containing protein [Treponema sp.]
MTGTEFAIIFFQSLNKIGLCIALCYVYKHRHLKLTDFLDFACMSACLLATSIIFDLALIQNVQEHLAFVFAFGTAFYFLAHGFYACVVLALFGYYNNPGFKFARLFLVVPGLLVAAACVRPEFFFHAGTTEHSSSGPVFFAAPVFWAAFVYLAAVYIFLFVAALRSPKEYILQNKGALMLFTLLPALFQSACLVFEACFPARIFSVASCTGFLTPLLIIYSYWRHFSSSRQLVAEDTNDRYIIFDVFGVCADSNAACRRFFRDFYDMDKAITLRTLSELIGISVGELLTMQTRDFQLSRWGEQKFYQIERFVVQLRNLNQLNGAGFWIRDVTLFKEREQSLANLIDRDVLTDLCSRRYFYSLFEALKNDSSRTGSTMAILMFDIDFFKRINDTYGHPAGDVVLQGVAKRVAACLRSGDTLCRFGGEEFLALLDDTTPEEARQTAARILNAVSAGPLSVPCGENVSITVSIGGTVFDLSPQLHISDLLQAADKKLYFAKSHNRNQAVF